MLGSPRLVTNVRIHGATIPVVITRRKRSKHLRFRVQPPGVIVASIPYRASARSALAALPAHADWISEQLNRLNRTSQLPSDRATFLRHKHRARKLILERLKHFNQHYQLPYRRVSIRNQSSRWGSCSTTGTLSFSFRLYFLPQELCDYVVVHELCHLKEHNHSAAFWRLVAETQPDYRSLRQQLRNIA